MSTQRRPDLIAIHAGNAYFEAMPETVGIYRRRSANSLVCAPKSSIEKDEIAARQLPALGHYLAATIDRRERDVRADEGSSQSCV